MRSLSVQVEVQVFSLYCATFEVDDSQVPSKRLANSLCESLLLNAQEVLEVL